MKCPVCNNEIENNINKCNCCGFDQLNKEFINEQEYDYWFNTVVKTCQSVYNTTKNNTLKNASYQEIRDEFVLRPPVDYVMKIDDVFKINGKYVLVGQLRKDVQEGLKLTIANSEYDVIYRNISLLYIERNRELVKAAFIGDTVGLMLDISENENITTDMYLL